MSCNILKIILVQGFCPLEVVTARFLIGFRFNISLDGKGLKTSPFYFSSSALVKK